MREERMNIVESSSLLVPPDSLGMSGGASDLSLPYLHLCNAGGGISNAILNDLRKLHEISISRSYRFYDIVISHICQPRAFSAPTRSSGEDPAYGDTEGLHTFRKNIDSSGIQSLKVP